MILRLIWWPRARADLRSLSSWRDAGWIDSEVQRLAALGVGDIRRVSLGPDESFDALFLLGYRAVFTLDRATRAIHVWAVMRSIRPA